MKYPILPLLIFMYLPQLVWGQITGFCPGSSCQALAQIGSLTANGFEGINNPALLADGKYRSLSLYQETAFLQKEMITAALSFQNKQPTIPFSIYLMQYGNEYFKQQVAGGSLAKKLNNYLQIGVGGQLLFTHQYLLQSQKNLLFEIGTLFTLNKNIRISTVVYNINSVDIKLEKPEKQEMKLIVGCSYAYNEQILFLFEEQLAKSFEPTHKLALRVSASKDFQFMFGWKSNPRQLSFGIRFQKAAFPILLSITHHPILGFSPTTELAYQK